MSSKDEIDGVLVELGNALCVDIINALEVPEVHNQWSVTMSDLCRHTGASESEIKEAVDWINLHIASIKIGTRLGADGVTTEFSLTVMELEGVWVPYDGPYETTIIKTIEKRIHIIEPVEIGGGLKQPNIEGSKKRRVVKRTPPPYSDDEITWATGKIPDNIPGFIEPLFYKDLRNMVAWGRHIALEGPPGVGKSSAVEQLAAETSNILVSVPGDAGFHKRDLTGIQQIADGRSVIMAAEYATAAVKGWWCVIDEVNSADADALMYINSQIERPFKVQLFGRTYPVHKNFRLFVTYNKGLVGTKMLPQATLDRFSLFKISYPDEEFMTKLLILKGASDMREVMILLEVASLMWSERLRYQLSPRRLFDAILFARSNPRKKIERFLEQSILPYVWSEPEVDTVKGIIKCAIDSAHRKYNTYEREQQELGERQNSGEVVVSREVAE